jgi:hypothetical protein
MTSASLSFSYRVFELLELKSGKSVPLLTDVTELFVT